MRKAAEPTEKVAEASKSKEFVDFQCSQCDSSFKAEEDLNAHISDRHTTLPTPEKERAPDQIADLLLTPIHGQGSRTMSSPPLMYGCNKWTCEKTFTSEDELRIHVHEQHSMCDRDCYSTPCPWKKCFSNRVKQ